MGSCLDSLFPLCNVMLFSSFKGGGVMLSFVGLLCFVFKIVLYICFNFILMVLNALRCFKVCSVGLVGLFGCYWKLLQAISIK